MAHIKCVGSFELLHDQGVVHVKERRYVREVMKSAHHLAGRIAILLLIMSFVGSMITGAHGEVQNEAYLQSSICAVPHMWETRDYVLQALAVIIFAASAAIGVLITCRMFQNWPLFLEISMPNPIPIPAPLPALPVIPAIQGEADDIDDVLAQSPIPTRLNSPLTWL